MNEPATPPPSEGNERLWRTAWRTVWAPVVTWLVAIGFLTATKGVVAGWKIHEVAGGVIALASMILGVFLVLEAISICSKASEIATMNRREGDRLFFLALFGVFASVIGFGSLFFLGLLGMTFSSPMTI
jgi:hypothetical protein